MESGGLCKGQAERQYQALLTLARTIKQSECRGLSLINLEGIGLLR